MKNRFICAEEVAQELSVSKPYAYKLIRQLNEELKEKGFITISGRVNRQYSACRKRSACWNFNTEKAASRKKKRKERNGNFFRP